MEVSANQVYREDSDAEPETSVEETRNHSWQERRDFSIAPWVSVLIMGCGILIFYLVSLNFHGLPTPLMKSDEISYPDKFIAERAREILTELNKIGRRPTGSYANEVETVAFLKRAFEEIDSQKNPIHKLEYSNTRHSGCLFVGYDPHGSFYWYHNIQNVQIRLSPADPSLSSGATILVNSHFDSVPVSPGMSDDGIMVVVMLEVLRVLSQSKTVHRHDIVFLFNGAEEVGLDGSHAFITQHPWRHNITGLVNLDASGAGGKEILFQAGPDAPWLANLYAKNAPHPYASALGEELFQMELIPSDTDFRVFRDYGRIKGLDMAYTYNGYVYHTKYDNLENIPFGTYQHTGDNTLALVRTMANSEELDLSSEHSDGESVFFDYLGWFAISYTKTAGIIINVISGLLALWMIVLSVYFMCHESDYSFLSGMKELLFAFLVQTSFTVIGAVLSIIMAIIYDACGRSLAYYSKPWLVFFLYWIPFIFVLALGPVLYFRVRKYHQMDRHYQLQMWTHAQAVLLALILLLLTIVGIRSAFIILIPVIFYAFTMILNLVLGFQKNSKIWIPIMAVGQLFPFLFFSHLSMIAFTTFIPMAARGGPESNPDLIICAFSILMALLMTGFITPFIGFMRKDLWVTGGLAALILAAIIMICTNLGSPYRAEVSPQRHWIFHSQRNLHNLTHGLLTTENGYFLLPLDRHSHPDYLIDHMDIMFKAQLIDDKCDEELLCGMPLYDTRNIAQSRLNYWIPANAPYLSETVTLVRIKEKQPENRMLFQMTGVDSMGIFISPMPGIEIEKWSFYDEVIDTGFDWQGRPTYVINYNAGVHSPVTFWLDLNVPQGWTGKMLDIAVIAQFTHHEEERTKDFKDFINSFPDWTHVTAWVSSYNKFEF